MKITRSVPAKYSNYIFSEIKFVQTLQGQEDVMAPQDSKENKILNLKIKEEGKIIQKVGFTFNFNG